MLYLFYIVHGLEESKRSRDTLRLEKNKGSRKFCRLIHKQDRSLTGIILRISLFVMECTIYGFVKTLRIDKEYAMNETTAYYRHNFVYYKALVQRLFLHNCHHWIPVPSSFQFLSAYHLHTSWSKYQSPNHSIHSRLERLNAKMNYDVHVLNSVNYK